MPGPTRETSSMRPLLRKLLLVTLLLIILAAGAGWFLIKDSQRLQSDLLAHAASVLSGEASLTADRTPGELIRYTRGRLAGHPKLEFFLLPLLDEIQPIFERPVPPGDLHRFGKGQRLDHVHPAAAPAYLVASTSELEDAMRRATAGQVIELLSGNYRIDKTLYTRNAGQNLARITVRAAKANAAILEVGANAGFAVTKPFWTFENLRMVGVCQHDEYCEHAFHVTGEAQNTIIRNNHLEDFSAHIKVNGFRGNWPDDGELSFNTLINTRPRNTSKPVTPFDLVGASRWLVADNYVANFVKADPKSTAYGLFMKGAGFAGRIERNVVVCTLGDISQPGTRVGISFGGGGSGAAYCRDGACEVEFSGGRAVNNIVAHCNDFGIDVNRSRNSFIAHNTLINTGGIDVRGTGGSALAYGNLFEGIARARTGGILKTQMNENHGLESYFSAADNLLLHWQKLPEKIPSHEAVPADLCGRPRPDGTLPGALEEAGPCG